MLQNEGVAAIGQIIQLSVAPVFLISGIGAMLAVMTNRLARVVDRARVLEGQVLERGSQLSVVADELSALAKRAKLISRSIALCTATALLICGVIAVLFLGSVFAIDVSKVIALLFVGAMLASFVGLLLFLWEIRIATHTLSIGLASVPAAQFNVGPSLTHGAESADA